jgi:hypothetical protein
VHWKKQLDGVWTGNTVERHVWEKVRRHTDEKSENVGPSNRAVPRSTLDAGGLTDRFQGTMGSGLAVELLNSAT